MNKKIKEMWEEYKQLDKEADKKYQEYINTKDILHKQYSDVPYGKLERYNIPLRIMSEEWKTLSDKRYILYEEIQKILNKKLYDLGNGKFLVHIVLYGDEDLEEYDAYKDIE